MMKKPFAAALLVAGLAVASGPVLGQDSTAQDKATQDTASQDSPEGEVIAVVNGQNIYESDLMAFIQQLPPQLQSQVQMLMPQILDQLVNNALTTEAGRSAGLADDGEVQKRVAKIEDLIIGQTYLQRAIDAQVTDEALESAYQKHLEENPPQRQLKARHILVETEEQAQEVIAELDGGADFAELAKERSTGPSGPKGGELPPFKAGEMVPAFSEAAFAMEVGTHSKEPVQTQFGYHVIKVEDSTLAEPPAKAEVEQQLRGELEQAAAAAVYDELRADAEVDIRFGKAEEGEAPAGEAPAGEEPPAPTGN
ncbi:MAG: peptidylprolyl isomerase [Kiloniellaceae bacterium]|nr:peptidylprolyl isomerase [Kiloniellaceae bacterium]